MTATPKELARMTIRLEPQVKEALEREARRAHRTLNGHVQHLIERSLAAERQPPEAA